MNCLEHNLHRKKKIEQKKDEGGDDNTENQKLCSCWESVLNSKYPGAEDPAKHPLFPVFRLCKSYSSDHLKAPVLKNWVFLDSCNFQFHNLLSRLVLSVISQTKENDKAQI